MRLIIVYGPPAAGKLTVSTELAKQTGYQLFHNHLTVEVARAIFKDSHYPNPAPEYHKLLKKLRIICVQAAAESNIDLIMTLAYSGKPDDHFIATLVDAVTRQSGEVHFVQLTPPDNTLMERVSNQSRVKMDKLHSPETLRWLLDAHTMRESVKYPDILKIDTSLVDPVSAAEQIKEYCHIGQVT